MFEQLGEKIANIGNNVVKGASNVIDNTKQGVSNFSETVSLKNTIDKANTEIKSTLGFIGQKFYNDNKDSVPEGYEDYFAKIEEAKTTISSAQKEIDELKNEKKCPNCGSVIKKGASFCTNCGAKVEEEKPKDGTVQCPNCKAMIPNTSAFCNQCGSKIEAVKEAADEQPVEKTCPKCGNKIDDDAAFCNMCGEKLG